MSDIAQLEKTLEASLKAAFNAIDEKSKDAASAAKAKDFIAKGVDILVETAKQGKLDTAVDVDVEGTSVHEYRTHLELKVMVHTLRGG